MSDLTYVDSRQSPELQAAFNGKLEKRGNKYKLIDLTQSGSNMCISVSLHVQGHPSLYRTNTAISLVYLCLYMCSGTQAFIELTQLLYIIGLSVTKFNWK